MHAVIPVAGMGTRLRPITHSTPKALIPVAGRPVLGHIIDRLLPAGVDRITLVIGHLGDAIVDWVRSSFDIPTEFVRQERIEGLASAVALAGPRMDDGPTMVVLGDTVFEADLSVLAGVRGNMLAVCRVDDPSRFGVVVERDGRAVRLVEKPVEFVSDLAIVGIYHFASGSRMVDACRRLMEGGTRTRGEFQLTDAMQLMIDEGEEFGLFGIDDWLDCGRPETLLETNRRMLAGAPAPAAPAGCLFVPPVHVHPGAVVESSIIGPNASVGDGCVVRNSIIRDSIAFGGCSVEASVLEGSILGYNAAVRSAPRAVCLGDDSSSVG